MHPCAVRYKVKLDTYKMYNRTVLTSQTTLYMKPFVINTKIYKKTYMLNEIKHALNGCVALHT